MFAGSGESQLGMNGEDIARKTSWSSQGTSVQPLSTIWTSRNSAKSFSMESGGFTAFFKDVNLNIYVLICINMCFMYNELLCVCELMGENYIVGFGLELLLQRSESCPGCQIAEIKKLTLIFSLGVKQDLSSQRPLWIFLSISFTCAYWAFLFVPQNI